MTDACTIVAKLQESCVKMFALCATVYGVGGWGGGGAVEWLSTHRNVKQQSLTSMLWVSLLKRCSVSVPNHGTPPCYDMLFLMYYFSASRWRTVSYLASFYVAMFGERMRYTKGGK